MKLLARLYYSGQEFQLLHSSRRMRPALNHNGAVRDGVLNRSIVVQGRPHPPATVEELELLPGVVEACEEFHRGGFLLIVVTNQPDVARGTQRREVVESINEALLSSVPIDEIRVCYHDDQDRCACRKPLPGLLMEAARDW